MRDLSRYIYDEQTKDYVWIKPGDDYGNMIHWIRAGYGFFDFTIDINGSHVVVNNGMRCDSRPLRYAKGDLAAYVRKYTLYGEECYLVTLKESGSNGEETCEVCIVRNGNLVAVADSVAICDGDVQSFENLRYMIESLESYNVFHVKPDGWYYKKCLTLGREEQDCVIDEYGLKVSPADWRHRESWQDSEHVIFEGEYQDEGLVAKDIRYLKKRTASVPRYSCLFECEISDTNENNEELVCIYDEKKKEYIKSFDILWGKYVGVREDGEFYRADRDILGKEGYISFDADMICFSLYDEGRIEIVNESGLTTLRFSGGAEKDLLSYFHLNASEKLPETEKRRYQGTGLNYAIYEDGMTCEVILNREENKLTLKRVISYCKEAIVPTQYSDVLITSLGSLAEERLPEGYGEPLYVPRKEAEIYEFEPIVIKPLEAFLEGYIDKEVNKVAGYQYDKNVK